MLLPVGRTMRTLLIALLLSAPLLFAAASATYAEVNDDYALKISLENQLERKLKQVIMEVTGTDKVVIFVNAELSSARGGEGGSVLEKKKTGALVLPGVPQKKEFGTGQSEVLFGAGGSKYRVNKITLSIWIDKSVPGSIVDLINGIAQNVIGYSQTRGDTIDIKKVDFESKGFFRTLFAFPNFLWLILTVVGGFALVALGMFFMDPLKKIGPALKEIDWSTIRGTAGATTSTVERTYEREIVGGGTAAAPDKALASAQDAALPFAFVRERDIPSLAFLLKDRPAQDLAIVANYVDPALATRLLERFPKERQVEVAVLLGKEEIGTDKVPALEEMIKNRLTYVVGGENKLLTILDMANEDVRDSIVKNLESKDAATATRLKQRIKTLETIIRELPAQGIQVLFRNIDTTLFAQVLKSTPEEIQQKVLTSVSAGAAERLKEEMQLSRALSAAKLKRERQNLMVLVRRLITEGLVEVENS